METSSCVPSDCTSEQWCSSFLTGLCIFSATFSTRFCGRYALPRCGGVVGTPLRDLLLASCAGTVNIFLLGCLRRRCDNKAPADIGRHIHQRYWRESGPFSWHEPGQQHALLQTPASFRLGEPQTKSNLCPERLQPLISEPSRTSCESAT